MLIYEKQIQVKIHGDKLIKALLTNKIFSKQILSWNLLVKLCLNRELGMRITWLKIDNL